MTNSEVQAVIGVLSYHPLVKEIYEGGGPSGNGVQGEVYVVTTEDPHDYENNTFDSVLTMLGLDWTSNDCEGCYNEYVIT